MPRRVALLVVAFLALSPSAFRGLAGPERSASGCDPVGRGVPPRHWIGCGADGGPRRDLTGAEKVLSGVAIDVNAASAEDLAAVPGLSAKLGAAIVADRASEGAFASLDELVRVRGIGPVRLARARPHLACFPRP